MNTTKVESLPPPPGVISSIKAGFDAISSHLLAILVPLALDLFLWLGPRLSMERLFLSIQQDVITIWRAGGISPADVQTVVSWYRSMLPKVNLFWLLRTLPVGVTSLMFARDASTTPLGQPAVLDVSSDSLIGWVGLLILTGWISGALYFRWVARLSLAGDGEQPLGAGRAVAQSILLSAFWLAISLGFGLPVVIIVSLLFQLNAVITQVVILLASFLSMWLIVPLFFWPHGIFVKKQNALVSVVSSLQLARFSLPSSSMFVLTVFLLGVGLNFVWSIPPDDSWMLVVGLIGHAFITTALLAASFIYYRDMSVWVQTVLERLRANQTVAKQA